MDLTFRQRIEELAHEHEQLVAHCENLVTENTALKGRLAATEESFKTALVKSESYMPGKAFGTSPVPSVAPAPSAVKVRVEPELTASAEERVQRLMAFRPPKSETADHAHAASKARPTGRLQPRVEEVEELEASEEGSESAASWGEARSSAMSSRSPSPSRRHHQPCSLHPAPRTLDDGGAQAARVRSRSPKRTSAEGGSRRPSTATRDPGRESRNEPQQTKHLGREHGSARDRERDCEHEAPRERARDRERPWDREETQRGEKHGHRREHGQDQGRETSRNGHYQREPQREHHSDRRHREQSSHHSRAVEENYRAGPTDDPRRTEESSRTHLHATSQAAATHQPSHAESHEAPIAASSNADDRKSTEEPGEVNRASIVQGVSQKNNEPTWQAHILVPQTSGGINFAGRIRTFTVRCPVRLSEELALEDARLLEEASLNGPQAVRTIANELQRTKTSGGVEHRP